MIDDIAKLGAAAHQVFRGKLAFENRILQMISEAPQFLMNASEPFIVRNVVTDKVCCSHNNQTYRQHTLVSFVGKSFYKLDDSQARPWYVTPFL